MMIKHYATITRATISGAGFCLLTTTPALAQIENVIVGLDNSASYMPEIMELIAYMLGLFALYSGIVALKETSQEPGKKSIRPAIIRLGIAAMLIALPRTIDLITESAGAKTTLMPKMGRPSLMSGTGLSR
jgi:hypothetical protein